MRKGPRANFQLSKIALLMALLGPAAFVHAQVYEMSYTDTNETYNKGVAGQRAQRNLVQCQQRCRGHCDLRARPQSESSNW